jgi:hypothetical protein
MFIAIVRTAGRPSLRRSPRQCDFEIALSRLPGVRDVSMRADERTDRAIIDVRLDPPSP